MLGRLKAYFRDESGQTSTEYILLIIVAVAIVLKFKTTIEDELLEGENSLFKGIMNKVREKIQTSDL